VKVGRILEEVQDVERSLGEDLQRFAERHATEHDLYHTGRALAKECETHLERLAPFAERYSADPPGTFKEHGGLLERLRRGMADVMGRAEASGLVLVHDLRGMYLAVQESELMWVMLRQVALAVRDRELLEVANECHEAAEMRGKWLRTRIKESVPQVYAT
jgi:hypothetical protein